MAVEKERKEVAINPIQVFFPLADAIAVGSANLCAGKITARYSSALSRVNATPTVQAVAVVPRRCLAARPLHANLAGG